MAILPIGASSKILRNLLIFNVTVVTAGLRPDAARAEGRQRFFLSLKVRTFVKVPTAPVRLTEKGANRAGTDSGRNRHQIEKFYT